MIRTFHMVYSVFLLFLISTLVSLSAFTTLASAQLTAQEKLMTKRAARVDALRNLTETIYGVRIDSSTTVSDFITQSDVIRARLDAVIQGAKEVNYIEHADGTAEVTVEVTVGPVEDILGRRLYYDNRTFRATGYGAPPGSAAPVTTYTAPTSDVVRAKGYGIEPNDPYMSAAEKALMAKRAAKIDALRNLAEQVYGVRITSDSYVRDFVAQSDDMRARVNTFIQGATVVSEKQMEDGSYEAEVEIELDSLRQMF